jgi:hypothetical protein
MTYRAKASARRRDRVQRVFDLAKVGLLLWRDIRKEAQARRARRTFEEAADFAMKTHAETLRKLREGGD